MITIEKMHLVPIPGEDREYSLDVEEWRNDEGSAVKFTQHVSR